MKHLKVIVALVLALVIAFVMPLQSMAVVNKYVSEVYVAYGKDEAQAKKTLQDKGFMPIEGNLNEAGDTYVMIGVKTTNDIRDSVTDIAVMNMNGDYSVEDYKTFLKAQKTQIAEFLNEFMVMVKEYRQNLKNSKSKATIVREVLNNYIDDDTGLKMGDLLNGETLQDKVGIAQSIEAENPDNLPNLITILMQGNAQVIQSIELLLAMAADTADNTWLDRLAEMDYDALLDKVAEERPELNTDTKRQQYLDNLYEDDALAFAPAMAKLRAKLTEYETMVKKVSEQLNAWQLIFDSLNEKSKANYKKLLETDEWIAIGVIYEGLNAYEGGNYQKGELLEYFMEDAEEDDVEYYYPILASLSDGQRYGLPFIGLESLFSYCFNDDQSWDKLKEQNKASFGAPEDISVYANIDREIYKEDGSIALTETAVRSNTVDGAGTTGSQDAQLDTLARITQISWAATGVVIAGTLASKFITTVLSEYATNIGDLTSKITNYGQWEKEVINAIKDTNALSEFKTTFSAPEYANNVRAATQAHYAYIISNILYTATIVIAVITTIITVIDLLADRSVEQLPIPKYLVDRRTDVDGASYTINYKAAECNRAEYFGADYTRQKGSCSDINADEGKQWLALYVSKNSKAGNPIKPEFIYRKSSAPGYDGSLHLIGEKGAVNVAGKAFKNYSTYSVTMQGLLGDETLYLFYRYSADVKTYDESAGNMTASAFNGGMAALFGFGGAALGAILGVVVTIAVKRKKKVEG